MTIRPPQFDLERMRRDDQAAAARFPGPDYYRVLEWIHEELRPASYLEIGVGYGESLCLARPPTVAIGVDPAPLAEVQWAAETTIHRMTSAEFLATHADTFSFAFIDGAHSFAGVWADVAALLPRTGLIALHDTLPLDEETSAPIRTTEFYTGDAWKMVPFLMQRHPQLRMATVATAPSGLTLIAGAPVDLSAPVIAEPWKWSDYEAWRPRFHTLPNHREAVVEWLHSLRQKMPVQSMRSTPE